MSVKGNYDKCSTEAHKQRLSLGMCDQYDIPLNPIASLHVFCLCLCNGMVSGATIINFYFQTTKMKYDLLSVIALIEFDRSHSHAWGESSWRLQRGSYRGVSGTVHEPKK